MAYSSYFQIQGSKQGKLRGSSQKSHSSIEVNGFDFNVSAPRDVNTGQASGKRSHKPVVIYKEVDSASPSLFQAAATNESLSQVSIQLTQTGADGKEHIYDTVVLSNGVISKGTPHPGPNKEAWILAFEDSSANSAALQKLRIAASRIAHR